MKAKKLTLTIILGAPAGIGLFVLGIKVFATIHGSTFESTRGEDQLTTGDIIFHTSTSRQSKTIQLATHSKYSHCGMIIWDNGQCFVAAASKDVRLTEVDEFIERGKDGHYVVKRLKNSDGLFRKPGVLENFTTLLYEKVNIECFKLEELINFTHSQQ